jgi:hypothetical protein
MSLYTTMDLRLAHTRLAPCLRAPSARRVGASVILNPPRVPTARPSVR